MLTLLTVEVDLVVQLCKTNDFHKQLTILLLKVCHSVGLLIILYTIEKRKSEFQGTRMCMKFVFHFNSNVEYEYAGFIKHLSEIIVDTYAEGFYVQYLLYL